MRLFFALVPRAQPAASLVAEVAPLVAQLQAQPVPAQNLHATLCFVGAVESEKLDALRAVAATMRGARATLTFNSLEVWEQPKILCATAGIGGDARHAAELAQHLGEAIIAAGFSPDIKTFRPHFTLGRKVHSEVAAALEWPRPLAAPLVMRADRFVLMESRRTEAGSLYSVVDSWALDSRETQYFAEK
ncbi:MAG: RNA 2',3'-cyclic phosphodiesterase [Pseudomonadota bacterium]